MRLAITGASCASSVTASSEGGEYSVASFAPCHGNAKRITSAPAPMCFAKSSRELFAQSLSMSRVASLSTYECWSSTPSAGTDGRSSGSQKSSFGCLRISPSRMSVNSPCLSLIAAHVVCGGMRSPPRVSATLKYVCESPWSLSSYISSAPYLDTYSSSWRWRRPCPSRSTTLYSSRRLTLLPANHTRRPASKLHACSPSIAP
mmetsp:Transcript_26635/g.87335  ORF Transcript_26635/g.87335 Transcript_26635/m.87335 type:complete len:203 (-) Transcript_26635:222-830(-)